MSDQKEQKKDSTPKLSLRRETVRKLGIRSGIMTGMPCANTEFVCRHSGPCTETMPPTIA